MAYSETDMRNERLTYEELSQMDLSKLHILRRTSLESIFGLLEHCEIQILAPGTMLLEKGQTNQTMYLVLAGALSVHLDKPNAEPVAHLESGQTVGEISVIDDSPATAFVRASELTRLLAIDEATFWRLVEVSHEFATNMLLLLAGRLRANNSKIIENINLRMQLEHEASVDALTALRNRRWLDVNLPRMTHRHQFSKKPFCVVMLDVDHFKKFNDNFGHAAGDAVLIAVSKVIMNKLRPTDLAARYGGEEFCVMLPDTDLNGGVIAANRIREAVSKTVVAAPDGRTLPSVTISLGVSCVQENDTAQTILERADSMLYTAKNNGRNRVEAI
ncbi:MAG: GGDEF domain-containing protein [Deltaproteobacteria bacterium]|nr:GGDEF domain-containing protein [Deltaproteobacteria bacterium]MBN2673725.1 GGDEF domain-containing protein [Deltaproteobacteria bacterium]